MRTVVVWKYLQVWDQLLVFAALRGVLPRGWWSAKSLHPQAQYLTSRTLCCFDHLTTRSWGSSVLKYIPNDVTSSATSSLTFLLSIVHPPHFALQTRLSAIMAAAQATIVYDTTLTTDQSIQGQLFAGKKFWIGQRTPQRSVYVTKVRSNGGNVVPLEKGADYLICDHLKIDGPPGGISYKFIDQSIRDNALADPNDFLVGPAQGTVRDVGSLRPTKQSRTPFSTQDDAILWIWVRHCEAKGASIKGNEIYKQLEVNV